MIRRPPRSTPFPTRRASDLIPIQYAGLIAGSWLLADGGLSLVEKVGLALTLGCVNGIGINTAHELGHKRASLERWLSKVALADRKSTRLNSSHANISYAVFC